MKRLLFEKERFRRCSRFLSLMKRNRTKRCEQRPSQAAAFSESLSYDQPEIAGLDVSKEERRLFEIKRVRNDVVIELHLVGLVG